MQNLFATLLWAAEEGGESEAEGIDLLLPVDLNEVWAGLIAFAAIFFVIWRFAVPAFNELLENRQRAVKAELEAAEEAKSEAESLREDYRQQLAGAREEAGRIVEEARQAGDTVKADIVAKAEEEAAAIKARAADELAGERERATAAIRRQVADLSLDVAEKVVGTSLDRSAQQQLVDRYIDELGGVEA
jgi:F-type H+-transporting ATPase subunit b